MPTILEKPASQQMKPTIMSNALKFQTTLHNVLDLDIFENVSSNAKTVGDETAVYIKTQRWKLEMEISFLTEACTIVQKNDALSGRIYSRHLQQFPLETEHIFSSQTYITASQGECTKPRRTPLTKPHIHQAKKKIGLVNVGWSHGPQKQKLKPYLACGFLVVIQLEQLFF